MGMPSCDGAETAKTIDVLHETKQEKFQRLLEQLDVAEAKLAEVEKLYFSPENVIQRGGCEIVSGYNSLLRPLLPNSFFNSARTYPSASWSFFNDSCDGCSDVGHCVFSLSSCSSPASLELQQSLSEQEQFQDPAGAQEQFGTDDTHTPASQPLEQLTVVKEEHPSHTENNSMSSSQMS